MLLTSFMNLGTSRVFHALGCIYNIYLYAFCTVYGVRMTGLSIMACITLPAFGGFGSIQLKKDEKWEIIVHVRQGSALPLFKTKSSAA